MKFKELYAQQIKTADTVPNATRSSKIHIPMHSAIAEFVAENSEYKTQSMPDKEFEAQFS